MFEVNVMGFYKGEIHLCFLFSAQQFHSLFQSPIMTMTVLEFLALSKDRLDLAEDGKQQI